ncbi:hypothetical protein L209DRAFT_72476 [Thermothelomyces heterothallicus CBS 203.75]
MPHQDRQASLEAQCSVGRWFSCFDRDWKPGPLPQLWDCCTCQKLLCATILMPKSMCKPCAWSAKSVTTLCAATRQQLRSHIGPVCTSHMEGEERGWWRSRTAAETFTVRHPFLSPPNTPLLAATARLKPDSATASAAALPNSRRSGIATLGDA